MKKELASIELLRVVKELNETLINGKINKIYVDLDRVNDTKKELDSNQIFSFIGSDGYF